MTDLNDWSPAPPDDHAALEPQQTQQTAGIRRIGGVRGRTAAMATVAGLAGGGLVGGYLVTQAATTPSPSPSPSGSTSTPQQGDHDGPGGRPAGPRLGGSNDETEDQTTIATAIGISVTQLQTELAKDGTIAAVAKAHNVDPAKVVQALVDAKDKEIDAAVAAGTLTQAQGASEKARAQQDATDQVNGSGRPGGHGGPGGPGGPRGGPQQEDLDVVAGVLGISASQLQTDISNGQTIAAVAKAQNVDVAKVISTLADSESKEIDARVASGQLTQAEATQQKAQVTQRVTDLVNGTHTDPGPGH